MFTLKNSIVSLAVFYGIAVLGFNTAALENEVKAGKALSSPTIDGKLDDPCWKDAQAVKDFTITNTSTPSTLGTTAYVLYDKMALYIGVICPENDISSIEKIEGLKRDAGDVFRTDCVELMIDPENGKNDYYHIGLSATGAIADRSCTQGGFVGDFKWDGEYTVASYVGDKFWSCEIAIPFYAMGITPKVGSKWGLNICREKQVPQELSSIARNGAFNVAGNFAELSGIDVDFSPYLLSVDNVNVATSSDSKGKMNAEIKADITNKTGKDKEIIFEVALISPTAKTAVYKKTETVKNGEVKKTNIDKINVSEIGRYSCSMSIIDPANKRVYSLKTMPLDINFTPVSINLSIPWYRNSIYETQKIKDVVFSVDPKISAEMLKGATLTAGIRKAGDKTSILSKEIQNVENANKFEFPADKLPYGKLEISAVIKNGKGEIIADVKCPLDKLPLKKGEVWLGRDLKWNVDGKPFFLLGAWNYPEDFIPEYNAFTSEKPNTKYIDTILLSVISSKCKNLKTQDNISENERKIITEHVRALKDKPEIFAYYLSDEPEVNSTNAKALAEIYNLIASEDPYHPIIVSNDSMSGAKDYALCADINGLHPYPVTLKNREHNDLMPVIVFTEGINKIFEDSYHKQTIAYLHQGFNYGDHGAVNNRIPNYREYRDQNILSLICGAQGIIEYNRAVEHYPELYMGMPELTKELKYLGDVILAPKSKLEVKTSSGLVKSMLKDLDGNAYLLVCNAQMKPEDIEITVPGIGKLSKTLNVISEDRSVALSNDGFKDKFGPYEVHIYTTSKEMPKLATVSAICEKIDKANAARKKAGNLAFQMFEGDGVKVTASSSEASKFQRIDTGLWHIVDGVTDTKVDYYKSLAWHDSTPDVFPDWVEVQLPKQEDITRVVVYPFGKSLKDYSVQGFINGEWKDLDKVSGKKDDMVEHKFDTVKTDRIRLFVTAANGKNSEVSEMEIYGPDKK